MTDLRDLGRRFVLASNNAGKLRELSELLAPLAMQPVAQGELGVSEADETACTFVENALINGERRSELVHHIGKALHFCERLAFRPQSHGKAGDLSGCGIAREHLLHHPPSRFGGEILSFHQCAQHIGPGVLH